MKKTRRYCIGFLASVFFLCLFVACNGEENSIDPTPTLTLIKFSNPVYKEYVMVTTDRDCGSLWGVRRYDSTPSDSFADLYGKYPYCDYNIFRKSDWNYAFSGNDFELIEHPETDLAFNKSEPMLRIKAKVQKINWGYEDGYTNVCAKIPQSRKAVSEEETAEFVPYGCTTLRMTEMPFTEE